jgi:hypothetical protein
MEKIARVILDTEQMPTTLLTYKKTVVFISFALLSVLPTKP